jgi:hypothetical protein
MFARNKTLARSFQKICFLRHLQLALYKWPVRFSFVLSFSKLSMRLIRIILLLACLVILVASQKDAKEAKGGKAAKEDAGGADEAAAEEPPAEEPPAEDPPAEDPPADGSSSAGEAETPTGSAEPSLPTDLPPPEDLVCPTNFCVRIATTATISSAATNATIFYKTTLYDDPLLAPCVLADLPQCSVSCKVSDCEMGTLRTNIGISDLNRASCAKSCPRVYGKNITMPTTQNTSGNNSSASADMADIAAGGSSKTTECSSSTAPPSAEATGDGAFQETDSFGFDGRSADAELERQQALNSSGSLHVGVSIFTCLCATILLVL